jgi:Cu(I)/Ag(I) efflux system membrane fusion protein
VLSPTSRTVDARINIDNEQGLLKPGMFGRVKIKVSIGKKGEVINPELAGKWISPMHPEIIKDGPGQCDICGMDLVPVESLGISTDVSKELPMIVPETAILWSGPRSIAFKETDKKTRLYEPVEVKVGPKVDGGYLIFSGLKKDDVVVTEGAFKLDAEQQIRAKTSMMDPHRDISDASARVSNFSDEEVKIIEQQIKFNLDISAGLAQDDLESARKSAHHAHEHLPELKNTGNQDLAEISDKLMPVLMKLMQSKDIKSAREDLFTLTPILKELITLVENQLSFSVHEDFCPMAFDNKGAAWFQSASELANPYYGAMMLRCGETRKVWNEGKD